MSEFLSFVLSTNISPFVLLNKTEVIQVNFVGTTKEKASIYFDFVKVIIFLDIPLTLFTDSSSSVFFVRKDFEKISLESVFLQFCH